ncbi:MAG: hypothetical protein DMG69_27295 [Acidobacteria bacterium]|nr:MAG: hypothetical protein DMG69_27295 [Acidobacteriota bacterium]
MEMNHKAAERAELLARKSYGETGQCPDCQQEDAPLRHLLSPAHDALLAASERPETFWHRQQAAIRSRIVMAKTSQQPVWGFLVAASVLILLTMLLLPPDRVNPVAATEMDTDDELLVAVEQVVQTHVPDALAPASLLSEDTTRLTQNPSKESPNAN